MTSDGLRIVQINTLDVQGGAARAAYGIHRALLSIGADSTYFVRDRRRFDDPSIRQFIPDPSPAAVEHRARCKATLAADYNAYKETRDPNIEQFSQERIDGDENFFVQRPRAEIINLHWIAGFVDYHLFFTPQRTDVPVVWTLHDMNAFTGGCHFDLGCGQFATHCGACPLLGSTTKEDLTHRVFEAKKRIFDAWSAERLHIVGPSTWTQETARASALLGKYDSTCIPPSIDTDLFRPIDKASARSRLGLPQNAHLVLFMSHNVGLPRKGLRELVQALSLMPDTRNLVLLVVGDNKAAPKLEAPFQIALVDYIGDDNAVAALYSAVDVTAVPSRQDVGPLTMLESMSCGTPVVGFAMGGVPDMVTEGETGFLAPPGDIAALAAAFARAFSDRERLRDCGARGRALVELRHKPKIQADAYLALYQRLHEDFRRRGF